jgi:hypothetical protein
MSHRSTPALPSVRCNDYVHQDFLNYLAPIHAQNKNAGFSVCQYTHGLSTLPVHSAYQGGVYSPTQNRIYFVPSAQSEQAQWHYIDCTTGDVVAYTHGATAVINAYQGGSYSPTQNRIYFAPCGQADQTQWHYIDCTTGDVIAYTHGVTTEQYPYIGVSFSPTQNRIYFVPSNQSDHAQWHYLQEYTSAVIPPAVAAYPMFNKL